MPTSAATSEPIRTQERARRPLAAQAPAHHTVTQRAINPMSPLYVDDEEAARHLHVDGTTLPWSAAKDRSSSKRTRVLAGRQRPHPRATNPSRREPRGSHAGRHPRARAGNLGQASGRNSRSAAPSANLTRYRERMPTANEVLPAPVLPIGLTLLLLLLALLTRRARTVVCRANGRWPTASWPASRWHTPTPRPGSCSRAAGRRQHPPHHTKATRTATS